MNSEFAASGGTEVDSSPQSINWQLGQTVASLRDARTEWRDRSGRNSELGGRELPSRQAMAAVLNGLCGALFPMRLGPPELREESEDYYVGHTLKSEAKRS